MMRTAENFGITDLFFVLMGFPADSGQIGSLEDNSTTGHCDRLTPANLTFLQARSFAQSIGGHLVAPDDANEQAWLNARFPGPHSIGLADDPVGGTFVWDKGQPLLFTKWAIGQPDNASPFGTNARHILSIPAIVARGVADQDAVNNVVIDFVLSLQVAPNAPTSPLISPPTTTIVQPSQEIPMSPPVESTFIVFGPAVIGVPTAQAPQTLGATLVVDRMGTVLPVEVDLGDMPGGEIRAANFSFIPTATGKIIETEAQVVASTGPLPSVTISKQYPGTGMDLRIHTGINSPPDTVPVTLPLPGERITMLFDSPTGSLIGGSISMIVQVKETIDLQNPIAPGVWMSGGLLIVVDGLPESPSPRVIGPMGTCFSGPAVSGLVGLNPLVQGVVLRPGNVPPYAVTDAHEIRFQH